MKVRAKTLFFRQSKRIRPGEEFEVRDQDFDPETMERVGGGKAEPVSEEVTEGAQKPAPRPAPKPAPRG